MKALQPEQLDELKLRFQGFIEYEKRILAYQEEIKECNTSKKEIIKALAEILEVKPPAIRKAMKEYMESITDKDSFSEKEEVLTLLLEQIMA